MVILMDITILSGYGYSDIMRIGVLPDIDIIREGIQPYIDVIRTGIPLILIF